MYTREYYIVEFKMAITRNFLKTVSAFSNYNDGEIIFGINDEGKTIGVEGSDDECLQIENMIISTINPVPQYTIDVKELEDQRIIILKVFKGKYTPYYYHGRAYKRSNTSTLEVDRFELNRLVLEGLNKDYEESKSLNQDLRFENLEDKLKKEVGINKLSLDILKTLNLYDKEEYYNKAGELFADENEDIFPGIDIVKFGKNINQILFRETLRGKSLLYQYDKTVEKFEQYYELEEIQGYHRSKRELIPKAAFRESLANAVVHREWDIKAHIMISMYDDRIEINSPGRLPKGISKEEYLSGNISVLRNPIIAGVFFRLNLIEQFGTGIRRIIQQYEESVSKPRFYFSDNNIKVVLPVLEKNSEFLSEDERVIYTILKREMNLSRAMIDEKAGFNKAKTLRVLNDLINRNIVIKRGQGPKTSYSLNLL